MHGIESDSIGTHPAPASVGRSTAPQSAGERPAHLSAVAPSAAALARKPAHAVVRYLVPVGLVVLVFLAFMPALDAGYVDWDDDDLLLKNVAYRVLDGEALRWMFTTSYAGHFQPLTWLSYSLDYAWWQTDPFGFHLTNVVLHALAAVVFYSVVRRLLIAGSSEIGQARAMRSVDVVFASAVAAAVFAVHPLRAESVAWLAERRDVLAGVFLMISVLCYLRYAMAEPSSLPSEDALRGDTASGRQGEPVATREFGANQARWGWNVLAVVSCAISLLAKASAMSLCVVLLILDVYPLRRLGGIRGYFGRKVARVWLEKLPFVILGVAAGVRALLAQRAGGIVPSLTDHDGIARFAQACYGLTFYLAKTIVPVNLGPLYQLPARETLLGAMFWQSLGVLAILGYVVWRVRKRWPAVPTALAVYVAFLIPVLGFAQSGPQLVADRYSYFACLGLAVLVGAAVRSAIKRQSFTVESQSSELPRAVVPSTRRFWLNLPHRRPIVVTAVAVLLTALSHATFAQCDIWSSPLHLWFHGVRVSPDSSIARVNYADALAQSVDARLLEEAVEQYHIGLRLDPKDAIAHQHLGELYRLGGYRKEAIERFERSLELDPLRPRARRSLAELLIEDGEVRRAVEVLRRGVHENPYEVDAVHLLAKLLAAYPDEAVRNGPEAVKLAQFVSATYHGRDPRALMTLASAYAEAGRFDEAIESCTRALQIAEQRGDRPLVGELRARLVLFQTGKPYRGQE